MIGERSAQIKRVTENKEFQQRFVMFMRRE